jgi:hypothetical protein
MFVFRERHHAVANVTGRKYLIFAPQPAGTAAVIRHGHNGRKIRDRLLRPLRLSPRDIFLQPSQNGREPCAASECNNPDGPGAPLQFIFHGMIQNQDSSLALIWEGHGFSRAANAGISMGFSP